MNVRPWIDGRLKSGAFFEIGVADCVGDSTFSFWIIAEDEELSTGNAIVYVRGVSRNVFLWYTS